METADSMLLFFTLVVWITSQNPNSLLLFQFKRKEKYHKRERERGRFFRYVLCCLLAACLLAIRITICFSFWRFYCIFSVPFFFHHQLNSAKLLYCKNSISHFIVAAAAAAAAASADETITKPLKSFDFLHSCVGAFIIISKASNPFFFNENITHENVQQNPLFCFVCNWGGGEIIENVLLLISLSYVIGKSCIRMSLSFSFPFSFLSFFLHLLMLPHAMIAKGENCRGELCNFLVHVFHSAVQFLFSSSFVEASERMKERTKAKEGR